MPIVTRPPSSSPAPTASPDPAEPSSTSSAAPSPHAPAAPGVSSSDSVFVWANEGNPDAPGALQPIHPRHFNTTSEGRLSLSGARVDIAMPERIAVRVHEVLLTEVIESVDSPFGATVRSDDEGIFDALPGSARAGATTAFYAATQVIDDADRWAGHLVPWGDDGKLKVVPYSLVTDFFNSYFNTKTRTLELGALGRVEAGADGLRPYAGDVPGWSEPSPGLVIDGAASRDIVAHEAGHAVLYAVKPGLAYGVGRAYQEGFADALAALTALGDADVVARVLEETGGDLTRPSEVTRVAEEVGVIKRYQSGHEADGSCCMRSLLEDVTLADFSASASAADVPGMDFSPTRSAHRVGHIFSRAVYDFMVAVYKAEKRTGATAEAALAAARDVAGTVLLRATRYVPEHHVTFESVALAMVRVEDEVFGQRHRGALVEAFQDRGVFSADVDVDALLEERAVKPPAFTLPPTVTDPADILAQLKEYEQLALAQAGGGQGPHTFLLFHNHFVPAMENVSPDAVTLHSDLTDDEGYRVLRLAYESARGGHPREPFTAYLSVVLDPAGELVDVKSDRAIFPTF